MFVLKQNTAIAPNVGRYILNTELINSADSDSARALAGPVGICVAAVAAPARPASVDQFYIFKV